MGYWASLEDWPHAHCGPHACWGLPVVVPVRPPKLSADSPFVDSKKFLKCAELQYTEI